jgi:hypothetical protein
VTAFLLVRSITDSRSNRVFCVHACGRLLAIGPPASTARLRTCALSPTRSQAVPRGAGTNAIPVLNLVARAGDGPRRVEG